MGINIGDMVMKEGWDRWYEVRKVEDGSIYLETNSGTLMQYLTYPPLDEKQWIVKPQTVKTPEIDHFEYVGFKVPLIGEWICEPVGVGGEHKLKQIRNLVYDYLQHPIYRPIYVQQKSVMGFDEWW